MVSKFVRGHSPLCTFCSLNRNPEDERETPLHLFFQCVTVEPIIEFVFRHFFLETIIDEWRESTTLGILNSKTIKKIRTASRKHFNEKIYLGLQEW